MKIIIRVNKKNRSIIDFVTYELETIDVPSLTHPSGFEKIPAPNINMSDPIDDSTIDYEISYENLSENEKYLVDTYSLRGTVYYNNKLYSKPYIKIFIEDQEIDPSLKNNSYVAKIKTDINCKIKLFNPEKIPGYNEILDVKLKDRNSFLDIESQIVKLDPETGEYNFTIRSDYPGIACLRSKDPDILCDFFTTEIKFKQ